MNHNGTLPDQRLQVSSDTSLTESPRPESESLAPARISIHAAKDARERLSVLRKELGPTDHPAGDLRWPLILDEALHQRPYLIEAQQAERTVGHLPLACVSSLLFGKYLVGLPYINSGGVVCDDKRIGASLIDKAVDLSAELNCRFLELRHEQNWEHVGFNGERTDKVHMRRDLPETAEQLWDSLKGKVRNQVRKGRTHGFTVTWGGTELLNDFYNVFSRRMHELGTPVYSSKLFDRILHHFDSEAELCCLQLEGRTIGSALLVHGDKITEVPSAATLTKYNPKNVNMLMYWHLLERAVERGQTCFDFGRASRDSNTYRFKTQWGAEEEPAVWQYHVRQGSADALRPENSGNQRLVQLWKKMPLWFTRLAGPIIVRGIP